MSLSVTPGEFTPKIIAQTHHALACGALHPILTDYEILVENGIPFLVRIVSNLARKKAETPPSTAQAPINPFLPHDPNLFVADLSDTHRCLLNKYNVVDRHILIVTREFEPQESWLTWADFYALWIALAEIDGLGFYNSGAAAGASQPHKHLQVIPLPLIPQGKGVPIEVVFPSQESQISPYLRAALPFPQAIAFFDPQMEKAPENAAQVSLSTYHQLLQQVGRGENPQGMAPTGSYNLLVTRRWMMVVPRCRDCWQSIAVNALGFAGALLVRNAQELAQLKTLGIMKILQQVSGDGH